MWFRDLGSEQTENDGRRLSEKDKGYSQIAKFKSHKYLITISHKNISQNVSNICDLRKFNDLK